MPARWFESFRVPSMMVGFDSQQTGGGASLYKNNGHCSSLFGVFVLRGGSRGTPRDWHCRFFVVVYREHFGVSRCARRYKHFGVPT